MKTKLYRLSWTLDTNGYDKKVHELLCTETNKTYKEIEGNSGWASIVNKDKLNRIHSGILYGESLNKFHYEVFCLEQDIETLKKQLDEKMEESFNKHYNNFMLMKSALNG